MHNITYIYLLIIFYNFNQMSKVKKTLDSYTEMVKFDGKFFLDTAVRFLIYKYYLSGDKIIY